MPVTSCQHLLILHPPSSSHASFNKLAHSCVHSLSVPEQEAQSIFDAKYPLDMEVTRNKVCREPVYTHKGYRSVLSSCVVKFELLL